MKYDSDKDGVLTFRDFYDNILRRVPQEWLNWIYENVRRGIRDEFIILTLKVNGVDEVLAKKLIERTKNEGLIVIGKTFADTSKGYIYVVK